MAGRFYAASYPLVLTNAGTTSGTFPVSLGSFRFSSTVSPTSVANLAPGASANLTVNVTVPAGSAPGANDTVTVNAGKRQRQPDHHRGQLIAAGGHRHRPPVAGPGPADLELVTLGWMALLLARAISRRRVWRLWRRRRF